MVELTLHPDMQKVYNEFNRIMKNNDKNPATMSSFEELCTKHGKAHECEHLMSVVSQVIIDFNRHRYQGKQEDDSDRDSNSDADDDSQLTDNTFDDSSFVLGDDDESLQDELADEIPLPQEPPQADNNVLPPQADNNVLPPQAQPLLHEPHDPQANQRFIALVKIQANTRRFLTLQDFRRKFFDRRKPRMVPNDIIINTSNRNEGAVIFELHSAKYKYIKGNVALEDECLPFAGNHIGEIGKRNVEAVKEQLDHMTFCSVQTLDRGYEWNKRYLRKEKTYTFAQEKEMANDINSIPNQLRGKAMNNVLGKYNFGQLEPMPFIIRTDRSPSHDSGTSRRVIYQMISNLGRDRSAAASKRGTFKMHLRKISKLQR